MASHQVTFPMVGLLLEIKVKVGDRVAVGDTLAVFDSMKFKINLPAPRAGTVSKILLSEGKVVNQDDVFGVIETG